MDLLTRTCRDLRRLLAPDAWFSLFVLTWVLFVELVGRRQALTDVHDLFALAALACIGWIVARKHQIAPVGWVAALSRQWQRFEEYIAWYFALEIGIDLRGSPPLPRGLPRPLLILAGLLLAEIVVLLVCAPFLPLDARAAAQQIWYTGYLGLLALLWLSLLGATLVALYIPMAMIHDAFVTRPDRQGRRLRRFEGLTVVGYFSVILLAAWLLPPWVPLALCLAILGINLATTSIPSNPHVQFLWRYRNGDGQIRSIRWGLWVTFLACFMTLAAFDLVLLSAGSTLLGEAPATAEAAAHHLLTGRQLSAAAEAMPITTSLGLTLAWLAPAALLVLLVQTVLSRLRDPARPSWPVLFIDGLLVPPHGPALRHLLAVAGWSVRSRPAQPAAKDVCVQLVDQAVPVDDDSPRWPLPATVDELRSEEVQQRLQRRHEIQLRRRLLSGLERLFKLAAARSYRRGTGVWLAPHLWFVPGLARDLPEEEMDLERGTLFTSTIGLPYYRVLPHAVRHHAYELFQALQIDLIFVEDGVTFRKLTRVFRVFFEVYDMHGGRRRAEEVQFQGLPGTRVVIHSFQLDEPFKSKVYPEPEFENLARARILHIFKDRGEQEELLEDPLDFTRLPAPSAAY